MNISSSEWSNFPALFCRFAGVACLSHTAYQTANYFELITQSGHVVDPLTALTCIAQLGMVAAMLILVFINKSGWLQVFNLVPLASMLVIVSLQWRGI